MFWAFFKPSLRYVVLLALLDPYQLLCKNDDCLAVQGETACRLKCQMPSQEQYVLLSCAGQTMDNCI